MLNLQISSVHQLRPFIKPIACVTFCVMFVITVATALFRYISSLNRDAREARILRRDNARLIQERNARIPAEELARFEQERRVLEAGIAERDVRIALLEAQGRESQRTLQREQRFHEQGQYARIAIEEGLKKQIRELEAQMARSQEERGAQERIRSALATELAQTRERLLKQEQAVRDLQSGEAIEAVSKRRKSAAGV